MEESEERVNTSFSKILKFSLPVALIGIFELIMIWIDMIWIYILNGDSNAVSAIRLSGSLIVLIEAVSTAVISFLLVYISQSVGAGKMDEARAAVRSVFSFTIYAGIVIMGLGQILMPFIIRIYGVNASTAEYLQQYLNVFLWGYVAVALK